MGNIFYKDGRFCYQQADSEPVRDLNRLAAANRYSVSSLARALGLSRRQLHRDFVKGLGMGPKEWLIHQRILSALSHIEEGGKLEWIAREIGFASYDKFYREFRNRVKTTPSEFRRIVHFRQDSVRRFHKRAAFREPVES